MKTQESKIWSEDLAVRYQLLKDYVDFMGKVNSGPLSFLVDISKVEEAVDEMNELVLE